jgi:hypothetical protein
VYVADTGPAYPLRWDSKAPPPGCTELIDYGANVHIAKPFGAIDIAGG